MTAAALHTVRRARPGNPDDQLEVRRALVRAGLLDDRTIALVDHGDTFDRRTTPVDVTDLGDAVLEALTTPPSPHDDSARVVAVITGRWSGVTQRMKPVPLWVHVDPDSLFTFDHIPRDDEELWLDDETIETLSVERADAWRPWASVLLMGWSAMPQLGFRERWARVERLAAVWGEACPRRPERLPG